MLPDTIINMGNSTVQHGPMSDRVYLMSMAENDSPDIVSRLDKLSCEKGYTKIFAKVPDSCSPLFKEAGYITEAYVPGLFNGEEDARFMGKYLDKERARPSDPELIDNVLEVARSKAQSPSQASLPQGYEVRAMNHQDANEMAQVYKQVFDSYPFPVFDPDYLLETMEKNVVYFGITHNNRIVGLASAETDPKSLSAEMTDFATLPSHRGQGLAGVLLEFMLNEMSNTRISTLFTIARAVSFGMNITFARAGFEFSGTLINNTHIAGQIESMNVWHYNL
ncbi:MAG: putative beta-lysine N-acetyltransferase [Desulfonatronovibrio sp. MSAO_Bac4]|nr:MAG: putative beta-lysine N-acetyltransferase [Desulfonatronovibrio sp. MSAO_Bac4]